MATIEVLLPADQLEGTRSQVLRWLKAVGQPVALHEPLVEIETDKVTIEVPAPADGVLLEIVAADGTDVAPGALLGRLAPAQAAAATVPRAAAAPAAGARAVPPSGPAASDSRMSPAVRRLLAQHGLAAGAVRGTGEGGRITVDDVLTAAG
ncbi:MAG TPA: biotin/lipoyl-containing protein, partial [Steroidobacteraceae bacterium]